MKSHQKTEISHALVGTESTLFEDRNGDIDAGSSICSQEQLEAAQKRTSRIPNEKNSRIRTSNSRESSEPHKEACLRALFAREKKSASMPQFTVCNTSAADRG